MAVSLQRSIRLSPEWALEPEHPDSGWRGVPKTAAQPRSLRTQAWSAEHHRGCIWGEQAAETRLL